MRYLTYILFGFGGLIALAALAVVFLGDDEPAAVVPQGDANSEIIVDLGSEAATGGEGKTLLIRLSVLLQAMKLWLLSAPIRIGRIWPLIWPR